MIIGIGLDIVEISRIEEALKKDAFRERVFTPAEQRYCDARGKGRAASYAARFAAKEAVLKALGTGFVGGTWQDIELSLDATGQPWVRLSGYFKETADKLKVTCIHVSLTHSREFAAAQAIADGGAR